MREVADVGVSNGYVATHWHSQRWNRTANKEFQEESLHTHY